MDLDQCLAAALRGERSEWPEAWAGASHTAEACARIAFHGIAPQLVTAGGDLSGWPPGVAAAVRDEARVAALWEATHHRCIAGAIASLAARGVPSLVLKGTALAYSVWHNPADRRRGDTDLFVSRTDFTRARKALTSAGWRPGQRQAFQETWWCDSGAGFVHIIDLHWRMRDSLAEPAVFGFDACLERAVALPRLNPDALTTDPATAMINCALNHAAHRIYGYGEAGPRGRELVHLGGIADTDRLIRHFAARDWEDLLELAAASGTARVVSAAFELARDWLRSPVPHDFLGRLASRTEAESGSPDPWSDPPSSASVRRFIARVRAAIGWRAKRDVVLARLLPSANELGLSADAGLGARTLVGAHARRIARLFRQNLRRPR